MRLCVSCHCVSEPPFPSTYIRLHWYHIVPTASPAPSWLKAAGDVYGKNGEEGTLKYLQGAIHKASDGSMWVCSAVRGGIIADWNLHMIFLLRLPTSSILYNISCSFHMWHHPVKKFFFLKIPGSHFSSITLQPPVIPQICIWDIGVWLRCHGSYLFFSSQRLTVQRFKENSDWFCSVCRTQGKQTALFYSLTILKPLLERLEFDSFFQLWHISSSATMCDLQLSDQQRST